MNGGGDGVCVSRWLLFAGVEWLVIDFSRGVIDEGTCSGLI